MIFVLWTSTNYTTTIPNDNPLKKLVCDLQSTIEEYLSKIVEASSNHAKLNCEKTEYESLLKALNEQKQNLEDIKKLSIINNIEDKELLCLSLLHLVNKVQKVLFNTCIIIDKVTNITKRYHSQHFWQDLKEDSNRCANILCIINVIKHTLEKSVILLLEYKNDKNKCYKLEELLKWMILSINGLQREWNYYVSQTKNQLTRKNSFELELARIILHTAEEFETLKKNMLKNYLKNT